MASKKKRKAQRRIKKLSQRQETQIMKGLGGTTQPNSGSVPGHKSDGRVFDKLRVEAKFTQAESYKLELFELNKLAGECQGMERPVMIIDYKEKRTGRLKARFAVLKITDFERLANVSLGIDN